MSKVPSRRRKSRIFRAGLAAAAMIFAVRPGGALAAGWHYYDPECPIALGEKSMKFVAMQPKKSIDRVCDAIPEVGPTVIALDAPDPELREMNWAIEIVRDAGEGGGEEKTEPVMRLPVEKHRNGMVNFDHTFAQAGKYVLRVKMTSDDGAKDYVGHHPFTVGLLDKTEFYTYIFFGCFVALVGGGGAFTVLRKRKAG